MEQHGIIESFTEIEDAFHFLDQKVLEYTAAGWEIRNGTGVERVGVKWRVGLVMTKGEDKNG